MKTRKDAGDDLTPEEIAAGKGERAPDEGKKRRYTPARFPGEAKVDPIFVESVTTASLHTRDGGRRVEAKPMGEKAKARLKEQQAEAQRKAEMNRSQGRAGPKKKKEK